MGKGLSRSRIVEATLTVVAQEGLDGLTMRKVADKLDVEAMSLYRYIRNKHDLLGALHDHLIAQIPLPGGGPWTVQIRTVATEFRRVLFAHPRCVPLLATQEASTPRALALLRAGLDVFLNEGWQEEPAIAAFQTVFVFVIGHAIFHTAGGRAPLGDPWVEYEFQRGLDTVISGLESQG